MNRPNHPPMPPMLQSAAPPTIAVTVDISLSPDKQVVVVQSIAGPIVCQLHWPLDLAENIASGILDRVRTARDEKLVLVDILGREKGRVQ